MGAALVTGAGTRLGLAFARAVGNRGIPVAVHYHRSRTGADALVNELKAAGVAAGAYCADFTDSAAVSHLFDLVTTDFDDLDILVNSASIFEHKTLDRTDDDVWDRHLQINLTAPFILSRAFARYRAGRPGSVVNILDWRAFSADPRHFAYSISKTGLESLTRNLAKALAPAVRVNGLALGPVLPPPELEKTDHIVENLPVARWGTVEEAVACLEFLLFDADYITGQTLLMDGGTHLIF